MKHLIAVFIAVLLAGPAHAQAPATLQGTVRNAVTGDGLPLANVVVAGTDRGVSTDSTGFFRFTAVPPGEYTVVVTYVGYRPVREDITLEAGATRTLRIVLEPRDVEVSEVTVTGERQRETDLGVSKISTADIKELPAVLEPDVFRALQLLPGVKASSDFSSGLYIRGGSPDQTLILLDRAPVYNPTHVFGFFSTFNPSAIDDVVLYKGGFPAEYGGRLGSVVDIESRSGSAEDVRGGVSLGLLASRADIEGPYAHGTWSFSARRSTIEPVLAGLNSAGVDDLPSGFYFYDVNGTLTADLSPDDRLALRVYAGRDQLSYPFLDDIRFDVAYGNRVASATWTHLASDRLVGAVTASVSHYFSDPVAEISGTRLIREGNVWDLAAQAEITWEATPEHTVEAGGQVGQFRTRLENSFDGERGYSPDRHPFYGAAYVQDTFRPTGRWTLTGGLRVNHYSTGSNWRVAPRLTVEHRLAPEVRLQASYGRYHQYLTLVSSELFSAFDFWLTTGDRVPPAYGDQWVTGVKTQPFENLRIDAELYYRTMRDLFELDRRISDYSGLPYAETMLTGEGYAYGAELKIERPEGRLNGFLGYTLGRTERRFENFEDFAFYPPRFDRTHDLTAVLNYDLSSSWRATAVFSYATGQAYTEPSGQYKLFDAPYTNGTVEVFVADFNRARLPAYHRLDLGVRKAGSFFGIGRYEVQMQLVNAYGQRNIWFYLFQTEDDSTITRQAVPQIPVPLPNLALTLNF